VECLLSFILESLPLPQKVGKEEIFTPPTQYQATRKKRPPRQLMRYQPKTQTQRQKERNKQNKKKKPEIINLVVLSGCFPSVWLISAPKSPTWKTPSVHLLSILDTSLLQPPKIRDQII
jgi:hypothetical protein